MIKKYSSMLAVAFLAIGGFFVSASQASADIAGKYLAADLSADDLSKMISEHPILFWGLLALFIVICIGYGIYYIAKKREAKPVK